MKKIVLILLAIGIVATPATLSFGDIQSPPAGKNTRIRKLSRAIANLAYGISEIPFTWARTNTYEGVSAAGTYGFVEGTKRSIVRLGFGAYEFVTFPFPTYKGGYKPVGKKIWWDLNHGYAEFPPELGFQSHLSYVRGQSW